MNKKSIPLAPQREAPAGPAPQHHHHLLQQNKAQKPAPFDHQIARPVRFECQSDDINECADAFIKRFRQHLEIQSLESIENYHQMSARGL